MQRGDVDVSHAKVSVTTIRQMGPFDGCGRAMGIRRPEKNDVVGLIGILGISVACKEDNAEKGSNESLCGCDLHRFIPGLLIQHVLSFITP